MSNLQTAKEMVDCYKSEFPGEAPDWDSDWWSAMENWNGDFSDFLELCKKVWNQ